MARVNLFIDTIFVLIIVIFLLSYGHLLQDHEDIINPSSWSVEAPVIAWLDKNESMLIQKNLQEIDEVESLTNDSNELTFPLFKRLTADLFSTTHSLQKNNETETVTSVNADYLVMNDTSIYHQVSKGETVYSIARKYDLSIDELVKMNRINDYQIYVDQSLLIQEEVSGHSKMPSEMPIKSKLHFLADNHQSANDHSAIVANKKVESHLIENKPFFLRKEESKKESILEDQLTILSDYHPSYNPGIDIALRGSTPVMAIQSGKVIYAGKGVYGYRYLVIVENSDQITTAYSFQHDLSVNAGDYLAKGDRIATYSQKHHSRVVRLEIQKEKQFLDPIHFL